MIRARLKTGGVQDLPEAAALEVLTPDGMLAAVLFSEGNTVSFFDATDEELVAYAAGVKLRPAGVFHLNRREPPSP